MAELRRDPIVGRWVIISAVRSKRPGSYHAEKGSSFTKPEKCPFCEGHESMTPPEIYALRSGFSRANAPTWKVRVVPNKYPALEMDTPPEKNRDGMFDIMTGYGSHEVIIESPDHVREMDEQSIDEICDSISAIQERMKYLYNEKKFKYAAVFKNKGKAAGASLSHPHHQLIATTVIPKRVKEELAGAFEYFKNNNRCIFCDIIREESEKRARIVCENDSFISLCPYAPRFPFETWILPKGHCIDFHDEKIIEVNDLLAAIMKETLQRFNKAIGDPEYNYIIHTAPNRIPKEGCWATIEKDFHWHIELFPRIVKESAFEWGTGFYINFMPPEQAAKYMREARVECQTKVSA